MEQDGAPILRLLRPLYVEKSCLLCHASQGYKLGQVRGGLSVTVPLGSLWAQNNREKTTLVLTHAILWGMGMAFLLLGGLPDTSRRMAERDQARQELRVLSGLLPICAHCKKIRTDDDQWEHLESYISRHSEADFSHGLCPDCLQAILPRGGPKARAFQTAKIKPDRANPVRRCLSLLAGLRPAWPGPP